MKKHCFSHDVPSYRSCSVQILRGGPYATYLGVVSPEIMPNDNHEILQSTPTCSVLQLCQKNRYQGPIASCPEDITNVSPFLQEVGWIKVKNIHIFYV